MDRRERNKSGGNTVDIKHPLKHLEKHGRNRDHSGRTRLMVVKPKKKRKSKPGEKVSSRSPKRK